ncbi:MAG: Dihydrodipicolinate synthase [Pseudomonadota bacterium]
MFEGTYTALITPFKDGEVDYAALGKLVDQQVAVGIDGVVPCGSTGESATLSHVEHERVIAFVIERVQKRIKVIAGTGSNSTRESVNLTRFAKEAGADGSLLIAPYYNKPTQDGIYAHYAAIAEAVELPQIVYNVPGRCAVNIAPETIGRLAQLPNIVGVKEASGSLDQASRVVELCGPGFAVLAGDDSLTLPIMAVGGCGVISVVSNLLPKNLMRLVNAANAGDYKTARAEHYVLLPLLRALFLETNPIPVKAAMAMLGACQNEMRLPLTRITDANAAALRSVLTQVGLLSA